MLRGFPLTEIETLEWAAALERLFPDLDYGKLGFLLEQMMLGNYTYDRNLGIQNITIALPKIERIGDGYQFKTAWPG
jgi:hypothetical protein